MKSENAKLVDELKDVREKLGISNQSLQEERKAFENNL